jgi:hypothetical protein
MLQVSFPPELYGAIFDVLNVVSDNQDSPFVLVLTTKSQQQCYCLQIGVNLCIVANN